MFRSSVKTFVTVVALMFAGAATAQLPPRGGCGSGGTYYVDEGNGYTTAHYPDGSYVTTFTFTDAYGRTQTVVVDQGFDQPGSRDRVDC